MIRVERDEAALRIVTAAYTLTLPTDRPFAVLDDASGAWADLALASSLDTLGALDTTLAFGAPIVHEHPRSTWIEIDVTSDAWERKRLVIECREDVVSIAVEVHGTGQLTDVRLLGGWSTSHPRLGTGLQLSRHWFRSLVSPEPAAPHRIVASAREPAATDVIGGALPGQLHWFFTPPPFCFLVSRAVPTDALTPPAGEWLSIGLDAALAESHFTGFHYDPAEDGFSVRVAYEGQTRVEGRYRSPAVVLRPGGADPYEALGAYCRSLPPVRGPAPGAARADWWREPIFCGWGVQIQRASRDRTSPHAQCTQRVYDEALASLEGHEVVPATIVVDDGWQLRYARPEPDVGRWPDLRGWIDARHARGQRVLLWWKAWDRDGLPPEWCVRDGAGVGIAADPSNPEYEAHLRAQIRAMLGSVGLGADGLKIDFTGSTPSGPGLRRHGTEWGVSLLHRLLAIAHDEAKRTRPDALLITHAPNPAFADVTDMLRLNDMMRMEDRLPGLPAVAQMTHRARVAAAAIPGALVDTDDWETPDLATWRAYWQMKGELGVPALYYADTVGFGQEPFTEADYALMREVFAAARAGSVPMTAASR